MWNINEKKLLPVAQVFYLLQKTAILSDLEGVGLQVQSSWVTLCSRTSCLKWENIKVSFSLWCSQSLFWIDGKSVLLLFMCLVFHKFFCMTQTHINILWYSTEPRKIPGKLWKSDLWEKEREMLSMADTLKQCPQSVWGQAEPVTCF